MEMNSFLTWHIFLEVDKTQICQVKFGKLLEMLLLIAHLQEFAKIYLANPVFCQLLKSYAK
jgi:hypothetical protein